MNRKIIAIFVFIILTVLGLSGCFNDENNGNSSENGNGSNANVIMNEWQYETKWDSIKGDYISMNIVLKNNGSDIATFIRVTLYTTNQDGLLEANKTTYVAVNLEPNATRNVTFTYDYEKQSVILTNKITIRWNGGSREYTKFINL